MIKLGYIYCITNTTNDKKYVGETMYPDARWSQHRRSINRTLPKVKEHPLCKALRKYGVDAFTFQVVAEYSSSEEALSHENEWIDHFQSRVTQHGYNMRDGGKGGSVFAESSLRKMSQLRKGTKASAEARANMSASAKQAWDKRRASKLIAIQELHSLGLKNTEIAKELNMSGPTVGKCLKEMGIKPYIRTEKGKKEWIETISGENHYLANRITDITPNVLRMRAEGCSMQQIRDTLNCAFNTITRILDDNNVPKSHSPRKDKNKIPLKVQAKKQAAIPIILELRAQGKTMSEIRTVVKTGSKFVADVLKQHGLSKIKTIK